MEMKNDSIIKSSFWSMTSEVISKIISPLSYLVLVFLLKPEDFGIVAVATTILTFLYLISDLGVSKVIIQESGDYVRINHLADVGFLINLVIGVLLFLFMFFGSGLLASWMNQPDSQSVIGALSVQIIFFSLSSVQTALRKKNLDFRFLFKVRLITTVIPAIVSIFFAFVGFGYWAIVLGQIGGSFFSTLYLWIASSWKPKLVIDNKEILYILSKSIWSSLEQLVIMIPVILDTYLLSKYLGAWSLGIYSTSRTLFAAAINITLGAITPVIYSYLSKNKFDKGKFSRDLMIFQKLIFSFAVILGCSAFLFANEIEVVFFNKTWQGISAYFAPLFLIMSLLNFTSAITEGLRAKGKFKVLGISTTISTVLTIPLLFVSVKYGLLIYILTRTLSLFFIYPFVFYYSNKYLDINFMKYIANNIYIIIICIISGLILYLSSRYFCLGNLTVFVKTLILLPIFIVVYISNRDIVKLLIKHI